MKKLLVVLAVVVVVIGLAYAQTQPEKPSAVAPRYQLVAATATYEGKDGHQAEEPEVFLVDTENGRVWKYDFSRAIDKSAANSLRFPDYFSTVPVDGLRGWNSDETFFKLSEIQASRKNQKQP